jgi:hypothetical protein
MTAQSAKPYATVPTLFDRVHDELSAIQEITQVLGLLPDHETRVRVIAWISERFSSGFESAQPVDRRPVALYGRQETFAFRAPTAATRTSDLTNATSAAPAAALDERQLNLVSLTTAAPAVAPARVAPPASVSGTAAAARAELPRESMEALLRSLVADFQQLADEWGNT